MKKPIFGCNKCKHFRRGDKKQPQCDAFPDRIPMMFATGSTPHLEVAAGQTGSTVFEPLPGVAQSHSDEADHVYISGVSIRLDGGCGCIDRSESPYTGEPVEVLAGSGSNITTWSVEYGPDDDPIDEVVILADNREQALMLFGDRYGIHDIRIKGMSPDEIEESLRDDWNVDGYHTDQCLRDEKGRFAGGNCGGGGNGGGGRKASLKSRLAQAKAIATRVAKSQGEDLIVNTGGLIGSTIGSNLTGGSLGGALVGDIIGGLATRQALSLTQSAMKAKQRLRNDADYQMASQMGRLRRLGGATISEFNSKAFQRRLGNNLTGDLSGWALGNAISIATNHIPGVKNIPFRGTAMTMTVVPRIQSARQAIIDRTEGSGE